MSIPDAVVFTLLVTTVALCGDVRHAGAAEPPWPDQNYSHYASREPLRDVLGSLAASQGLALVVSDRVEDVISASFTELPPAEIFRRLAGAYKLSWYYDGSALYVYRSDELRSTVLTLNSISPTGFRESLRRLGVLDERLRWNADERRGLVFLSGPPRFIELASDLAERLDRRQQRRRRGDRVYRWTDAVGVTHFSSAPPGEDIAAGALHTVDLGARPESRP